MSDTFWITLPVSTWQILFARALKADRDASDFIRLLIEKGRIDDQPFEPPHPPMDAIS